MNVQNKWKQVDGKYFDDLILPIELNRPSPGYHSFKTDENYNFHFFKSYNFYRMFEIQSKDSVFLAALRIGT